MEIDVSLLIPSMGSIDTENKKRNPVWCNWRINAFASNAHQIVADQIRYVKAEVLDASSVFDGKTALQLGHRSF
jgi:hypothetical protein